MSTHSPRDADDRAALYALGALSNDEAREFEAHLSACEVCKAEVESFSSVAADLALAAVAAPRSDVRRRVLERIADDTLMGGKLLMDDGLLRFVRTATIPWELSAIPGIEMKVLFRDADRAYSAMLVRMSPGTAYPSHRHADVEELFLLEGDLLVSGVRLPMGMFDPTAWTATRYITRWVASITGVPVTPMYFPGPPPPPGSLPHPEP